jgi:hypothetical protein
MLIIGMSFLLLLVVFSWMLRQQSAYSKVTLIVPTPIDEQPTPTSVSYIPSPTEHESEVNITVDAPVAHDEIASPFILTGQARVFENVLNYRLTTASGIILSEGSLIADSPDIGKFGQYRETVTFAVPKLERDGLLEVFSLSAKDGSEINMVSVPVRFVMTVR